MKAVKRYKLPVIRQISTRDIMYNIANIINTNVLYITVPKIVNLESAHKKRKHFLYFFNSVSIQR